MEKRDELKAEVRKLIDLIEIDVSEDVKEELADRFVRATYEWLSAPPAYRTQLLDRKGQEIIGWFTRPYLTRADLVDRMARDAGVTKKAAEVALNSFIKSITDSLKKGKKVALVGFGTFAVAKQAAKEGRNPQTGEVIKVKAARVPRFRPGKALKEAVK